VTPRFECREHWVDGTRWFVRESLSEPSPDDPAVVLIAGLGEGTYLMPHARRLAERRRVVVPDLPGFGRSRAPARLRTVTEFADSLAAFLAARLPGPVDLVASSVGCQVVAALGARHPHLTRRLVLTGPTFDEQARSLPRILARWLATMWREPPQLGPMLVRSYVRSGVRTPVLTFRAALRDPIEHHMPRLAAPVLVVRGERDRIVPAEWAHRLAALAPHGQTAQIAGAAHTVDFAAPEELAHLTLRFLAHPASVVG
jgi:pimeloyl-ACP methyl ester carboxylesterase